MINAPLRWPGGKRRLAKEILSRLPAHAAYVETCCGGAGVFWAKQRNASKAEVLNDADGELINFYVILHKRGKRLAREVDALPYSRATFARVLASKPTSAFARASRMWYLNRVAFGAKRRGPSFGVGASQRVWVLPASILNSLDGVIERLRGVLFESLDLVRLVELYDRPTTFFYVDPPYYGVSQPYACQFGHDDHQRLSIALRSTRGKWFLSYNNCLEVRRLYRGLPRLGLHHRYTIGCNSTSGGNDQASEILISSHRLRQPDDIKKTTV